MNYLIMTVTTAFLEYWDLLIFFSYRFILFFCRFWWRIELFGCAGFVQSAFYSNSICGIIVQYRGGIGRSNDFSEKWSL